MDTTSQIKSNEPLVSILMLTYNRAHFIHEAIASIVAQNYKNWELIIIDDGSTDTTKTVVESFVDTRIKYIQHPNNAGLHPRRRESISYCKGKYVAILDSDDYWTDSKKLAEQVDFLEKNTDHVIIGTMTTLIDVTGKIIGQNTFALEDEAIRNRILIRNQFTHSGVMFRTTALQKTAGYQPILAEDLELILQLGKYGKLANLPHPYTAHRVHKNSQNDHGIKMASAVCKIIQKHKQNYPHPFIALIFSNLRLLKSYLKILF